MNKGRHRARSRAAQKRTQVSAVAAAVASMAVVGGAATPSAPAAGAPFVLAQKCVAGAGAALSNVNCQNAIASPLGAVIASVLPAELTSLLQALNIDINSQAIVLASDGTASIAGTGFALSAQALHIPIGDKGGASTANAVTPLSAAVAVGTGTGIASATSVSGVAVAVAGSGVTSTAVSVGGVATAINVLGIKNVTCTALYAQASATGVGRCTSVLYLFTAKNAAGSDVWTFAIADPTSLTVIGSGVVPVPHFARDLIRVSVDGSGGVAVGSDVIPQSSKSLAASTGVANVVAPTSSVTVSSKAATTPSAARVPILRPSESLSSVGKHRASDTDAAETVVSGGGFRPTGVRNAQSTAPTAQSTAPPAQSTTPPAQSTGVADAA